nr:hypothetical protein [Tanacetum cinerariifolium]
SPVPTAYSTDSQEPSSDARLISKRVANQEETPSLDNILSLSNRFEDILRVTSNLDESNGVEADISNMETAITAIEHKKISDALQDPSWVEAMQEELLQFKIQNVWTLVDCPKGMDAKSAFLYATIDEEVGTIDYTLFFTKQREDFILVQVCVDDIIFGSSNPQLCGEFEALMHEKFQMSAMGELNFLLGLQVLQNEDGIFLSQDKYVGDILKKFEYSNVRSSNIPMDKENPWGKDGTGKDVDLHLYRSMIGSLMYLIASRPDIMFAVEHAIRGFVKGNIIIYTSFSEHNADFHPMVDFIEASSLRRNLKLQDEEGISSLHDTELFENLTLMGYNISPNQKFTFQKGQFSHQWNPSVFGRIVPLFDTMLVQQGEGSGTPTEFHDTPSPEAQSPSHTTHTSPSLPPITTTFIPIDRETIDKSSTLPHDSAPRVTFPVADEGTMQQTIPELTALCTSMQRQLSELTAKFQAQEGRSMDEGEAATERISDDSEEMVIVLTSMDAATVLASEVVDVSTGSRSIPTASTPVEEQVPTGSDVVSTASPVFATATVIDAQVARELEEQLEREDQRKAEQIARDAVIARIHAKEELQIMINGLDRSNEIVAKYLQEYHQFASELLIERRIELITDLVKYQDNYAKIYKFQNGDFIPMGSKEEAERIKRKGLNLEQESAKKQKTSEEVPEEAMFTEEVFKEKRSYWKITRLGGISASYQFFIDLLKHLDREDLNQLWRLVKETLSNRPPTSVKEMKL